jgi:Na+-driven multidrug efflux pump
MQIKIPPTVQIESQKHHIDETSLGFMLRLTGPMVVTTTSFTLMQFVNRFIVSRLDIAAPAVGKSIGAGRERTAVKQTNHCLRLELVYMGLVGLSFFLFGRTFMRLWYYDDKVIQTGVRIPFSRPFTSFSTPPEWFTAAVTLRIVGVSMLNRIWFKSSKWRKLNLPGPGNVDVRVDS